jgi:hypothetical protein
MVSSYSVSPVPVANDEKAQGCDRSDHAWKPFEVKSWDKLEESHITHHQEPQLRRLTAHKKLCALSLLAVVILQYFYFGNYSCYMYKYPQEQDNHPSLHFAASQNWLNDPHGVFIDANKTWHLYFQC